MRACLVGIVLLLCACSAPSSGVTGSWNARVTSPDGETHDIAFNLSANGDTLTGSVAGVSPDAVLPIENGTILGDDVSFAIHLPGPDSAPGAFVFAARLAGTEMRGTVAVRDEAQRFEFTATRTSSSPQTLGVGRSERRHATRARGDLQPPNPRGSDPTPEDATHAVLAAFDRYEVVGMGILSYANQDFDQFILDLIRDPAFPGKVNDIEVECGNSLYQPLLDRYIAGDSVPLSQVRQVWRNTTQPFCGVTTFHEELFPLVRRINRDLPASRKLRVLAGDPPVDWSRVKTRADLRPMEDRDASIAAVMEREVLAKHRKALMIFGLLHLRHGGGSAVGRYERAGYANRTFVVMAHNGFGNRSPLSAYNGELERRMADWRVPSLVPLKGTWLDDLPWAYYLPDEQRDGPISAAVDAYLYLGPGDLLLGQPIPARAAMDAVYMAELLRRARIRHGPTAPNEVLREATEPGVFFNQQGRR